MSTVRLSDAIEPTVFSGYMSINTMQKSALYGTGVLRADGDDERQTEGETGEVGVHRKIRGRAQDEGAHFACKRRRRLVIGCAVLRPVAAVSEGNAEPPLRALRRLRFGFQSPAGQAFRRN